MSNSSDERRRSERVPINEEFSADGSTWVSDLSIGGVFVHTEERVPIGLVVEVRFTVLLDDPVVIEAYGKVVRHSRRPVGIGVQFTNLSKQMRERIEQALARQRPVDSGAPIRLPDPGHAEIPEPGQASDEASEHLSWARPAPVGGLRLTAAEDDVTATFPRVGADAAPSTVFRPPPLPGKRPIDEDASTGRFTALQRKEK